MIHQNQPADSTIHFESMRIAKACRHVIDALLREEERIECDREFYLIIRESLERMTCHGQKP
jgi:hypothetical protein